MVDNETSFEFKTIENANVVKFISELEIENNLNEGISVSSYFDNTSNYAHEFIVIDVDLRDKLTKGPSKKDYLATLFKVVSEMDNTSIILSSPQIEAFIDNEDIYKYKKGQSYKEIIKEKSPKDSAGNPIGMMQFLQTKLSFYLYQEYKKNGDIAVDKQVKFILDNIDEDNEIVKVRTVFNHIIKEVKLLDDEALINFIENEFKVKYN